MTTIKHENEVETETEKEELTVHTVTVFENGDGTTSVWGVFYEEKDAKEYEEKLLASELNDADAGYYLEVTIESHKVSHGVKGEI